MDFGYIREQHDALMEQVFEGELTVGATINIAGEEVGQESIYRGFSDSLDGRQTGSKKVHYPANLERVYNIQVYPLEKPMTQFGQSSQITYGPGGSYEPYDKWVSCLLSDVSTEHDNTYFDYAETVSMFGEKFTIKGIVRESFGYNPVVHVFLVKETNE